MIRFVEPEVFSTLLTERKESEVFIERRRVQFILAPLRLCHFLAAPMYFRVFSGTYRDTKPAPRAFRGRLRVPGNGRLRGRQECHRAPHRDPRLGRPGRGALQWHVTESVIALAVTILE